MIILSAVALGIFLIALIFWLHAFIDYKKAVDRLLEFQNMPNSQEKVELAKKILKGE